MKELMLGIVLIILLGLGGFLYQNATKKEVPDGPVACTLDARICPDGSAVGRTAPSCEFEACPSDAVTYSAPAGFIDTLPLLSSMVVGRVGFYSKEPNVISNNISVFVHKTSPERSFENVLLEEIVLSPSDLHPESLEKFEKVTVGDREVYRIINERFEATVEITYAVELEGFAVLVSLRDVSVENWMQDFTLEELEDLEILEAVVNSVSL